MPVTKSRTAFYDINLDQANTTGFLFGDDDNVIEGKLYTQANNEDNFPVLRREPNMVSQNLVSSKAPAPFSSAFPRAISTLAEVVSSIGKLLESILLPFALVEFWFPLTPLTFPAYTLHLGGCIFSARWAHLHLPDLTSLTLPHLLCLDIYLRRAQSPRFASPRIPCYLLCTVHFLYCC